MGLKKIISNTFRRIEQKSKLDLIAELLIIGNSTEECLELFKKVKANFAFEMESRKRKNEIENRLISNSGFNGKPYDANFDKKLSELEVEYQKV
jgi:hypothetical protein